ISLPGRPDTELAVVLDCSDVERLADFWAAALGYAQGPAPETYFAVRPADGASGIELLLQRVPETKIVKNRLHLDLRVPDLEAEVRRLVGLGATVRTDQPLEEDGWTWHILADPEANEFCVLQPPGS
ncbi:MAG TPA: VOC family protein, partial [Actinopolymorphaceae bacterium]